MMFDPFKLAPSGFNPFLARPSVAADRDAITGHHCNMITASAWMHGG
jgi:hypothetical protein